MFATIVMRQDTCQGSVLAKIEDLSIEAVVRETTKEILGESLKEGDGIQQPTLPNPLLQTGLIQASKQKLFLSLLEDGEPANNR